MSINLKTVDIRWENRHVFQHRAMGNACDSGCRCGLACDANAGDAKSLAMLVKRCEPLSLTPSCERVAFLKTLLKIYKKSRKKV